MNWIVAIWNRLKSWISAMMRTSSTTSENGSETFRDVMRVDPGSSSSSNSGEVYWVWSPSID